MVVSKSKQELILETDKLNICTQNNGIHGPVVTDSIRGEVICGSCGAVLDDKVEELGPEKSFHTLEDYTSNSRTGLASALSIHDKGLSTVIGAANKDASGNQMSSYMRYTFNRLRTWDSRSKSNSAERNLRQAFVILNTVQSKIDISDSVIERAAYLYRKAITKNITRGRTITGTVLSALYVACRESNVPRTLHDIADAGNISFKDISRHYRVFVRSLDLQVDTFDPSEFISKIGTMVGFSEKAKRDALDIIHRSKEIGITDGKNPVSLAASAIFLSGVLNKEEVTQYKIAKSSGISSVTIRNVAKIMRKNLQILD